MSKKLENALLEVIRDQINQKNKVRIDGLGTFHPHHEPRYHVQYKNGKVVLRPPKDSITFTPENNKA
ncbi:MAG TPA: HU family DNA-binding protein [Balneolales bacterium]|nr:HU family DNA-binding protein [Balneolales bacterium]